MEAKDIRDLEREGRKELRKFIKTLIPHLNNYFGDEQLVKEAISSVNIILSPDLPEVVRDDEILSSSIDPDEVKDENGIYASIPHVIFDVKERIYKVDSVDRYILINANGLYYDETKSALIHELCHLIKSYKNEFVIKKDIIIQNAGFARIASQITRSDDRFEINIIHKTGIGLEEGFNICAENDIAAQMGLNTDLLNEYVIISEIARCMMDINIDGIKDKYLSSQITHDNKALDSELGVGFYMFTELADNVYDKSIDLARKHHNTQSLLSSFEDLYNYVKNNMHPIFEAIRAHRRERK